MEETLNNFNYEKILNNSFPINKIFRSGIYFLLKDKKIVYVGQTTRGYCRIFQHINNKDFDSFSYFDCDKKELSKIESSLILKYRPKYNKVISRDEYRTVKRVNKLVYKCGYILRFKELQKIIDELNLEKFEFNNESVIKKEDIKKIVEYLRIKELRKCEMK